MDTGSYDFASLRKKYDGFASPGLSVLVDGTELSGDYAVLEAEVETTVENSAVGMAAIKLRNTANIAKEPSEYAILSAFPLAKPVEVKMGYGDSLKTVFKGYVLERALTVSGGEDPALTVYCLDSKALLRMNTACETYKDVKKLSGLVEEVLKKYPMPKDITATADFAKPMTLAQNGGTDWELLCRITGETGYELFDDMGKLVFRKPASVSGNIIVLDAYSILRLEQKTSLTGIASKVTLYGYNADTKTAEAATADAPTQKTGSGKTGGEWLSSLPATRTANLHMTAKSRKSLEAAAKTCLQDASLSLVELTAVTAGLPEIIPGRFVKLEKLGGDLNNTYYIRSVCHTQCGNSFTTRIRCASNTAER